MTTDLEVENARLRRRLARLGHPELPGIDLPSDNEIDRLIALVLDKYSQLRISDPHIDYRGQFANALHYFSYVGRSEKADSKHAVSFWIDECGAWLDRQGWVHDRLLPAPFIAALICSRIPFEQFSQPSAVNVGLHLGASGRPSDAWRETLMSGLPEPMEPRRPQPVFVQTQALR